MVGDGSVSDGPTENGVIDTAIQILGSEGAESLREDVLQKIPGLASDSDSEKSMSNGGQENKLNQATNHGSNNIDSVLSSIKEAEDLLPFDPSILTKENQEIRLVEQGTKEPPFRKRQVDDGEVVVLLNLDAYKDEFRERIKDEIYVTWLRQGRLLTPEQEKEYQISESGITDEQIHTILEYFDKYTSDSQNDLLRRCLALRKAWEAEEPYIPKRIVDKVKRDLDEMFEHGSTVANLCSSEYYDEGGMMREIMTEMEADIPHEDLLEDVYLDVVDERPFVMFVGEKDYEEWRVRRKFKQKIKQYDGYEYTVPFVDLRAQGYENRQISVRILSDIQQRVTEMNLDVRIDERESVHRVDTESVDGLV